MAAVPLSGMTGRVCNVLEHSRAKDFACRQAPILICVLVPLIVGLVVLAFDFVVGWI